MNDGAGAVRGELKHRCVYSLESVSSEQPQQLTMRRVLGEYEPHASGWCSRGRSGPFLSFAPSHERVCTGRSRQISRACISLGMSVSKNVGPEGLTQERGAWLRASFKDRLLPPSPAWHDQLSSRGVGWRVSSQRSELQVKHLRSLLCFQL